MTERNKLVNDLVLAATVRCEARRAYQEMRNSDAHFGDVEVFWNRYQRACEIEDRAVSDVLNYDQKYNRREG